MRGMRKIFLILPAFLGACVSAQFHAANRPQDMTLYASNRSCIADSTTPATAAKYHAAAAEMPSPLLIGMIGGAAGGAVAGLGQTPEMASARADAMQEYSACMAQHGWEPN